MTPTTRTIQEAAAADLCRLVERTMQSYRPEPAGANPKAGGIYQQIRQYVDDLSVTLNDQFHDETVFPAMTGYEVLVFEAPRDGDFVTFDIAAHVRRAPVIGWKLLIDCCEHQAMPITAEGCEIPSGELSFKALAFPDGQVEWYAPAHLFWRNHHTQICKSFDEWLKLVREAWPEAIKRVEEDEWRDLEQQLRWIEMNQPCPHCGRNKNDLKDELPF